MKLNKKNNFFLFLIFFIFSLFILFFDFKYNYLNNFKLFFININFIISNIYNKFYIFLNNKIFYFKEINYIINKNINLIKENILIKNKLYILNSLKIQNNNFRKILNINLLKNKYFSIVKLLFNINKYSDYLLINILNNKNIKYGNLLFNGIGIIGKLVFINNNFGKVQLICNNDSGFSGKILRTGFKVIVLGCGCKNEMKIVDLPINIDISIGDIIVNYDIYDYYFNYPIGIVHDYYIDNIYGGLIIKVKSFFKKNSYFDYNVLIK